MKHRLTGMILSLVTLLISGQVIAAGMAASGSLEQVTTVINTGSSAKDTSKVYWSGNNMRIENYSVTGTVVQIKKGSDEYIYSPAQKKAVKLIMPTDKSVTVQQILKAMARPISGGVKIGKSKILGFPVDIYKVTKNKVTSTVYTSTDPRLPLVFKSVSKSGSLSKTTEIRSVKLNGRISASLFSLPAGTKIEEKKVEAAQKSSK